MHGTVDAPSSIGKKRSCSWCKKKLHYFASYVSCHSSFKSGLINVFAKSILTCNSWLIFASEVTGLFSWHGNKATRPLVETASRQAGLGGRKSGQRCGLRATWQTTEPQKSWQSLCFPVCFFKVLQGGINPSDKWGFNGVKAEWFSHTAPRAPGWVDGSQPACMDRITRAPRAAELRSLADPEHSRHALLSSGRTESSSLVLH